MAEVNGDGTPDLLVSTGFNSPVWTLLGNGNGTFQPAIKTNVLSYNSPRVADVNGDGRPDLVAADNGKVTFAAGNGDGTFGTEQFLSPKSGLVTIADLNGDGRNDVVSTYTAGASGIVSALLDGNNGNFTGQVYTVVPPPAVISINRSSPSTPITSASTLSYAVTFSSSVTNVSASDFQLLTTGDVVATTPVAVSGSGTSWAVTINGVHGSGTIQLELVDHDEITDTTGTPLGGAGLFNASFAGTTYSII